MIHTERVDSIWETRHRQYELARSVAQKLDLHPVAAEILLQRGHSDIASMQRFLHPDLSHLHDPWLLPDMLAAVDRIQLAIADEELIAIYGDYDADGLTATALLKSYLREMGATVCSYIPQRLEEGYGLHTAAIEELAAKGVKLLISVDCGINAKTEVELANSLGMDVIITDHHTPDLNSLPAAIAILNPQLTEAYPFRYLAGVGVALKLVHALGGLAAAVKYLDLAAIGTIADVVPLVDENRVIVRFGIEAMRSSERPGIRALLADTGVDPATLKSGQIAFTIAPRLNAAGRLNQAELALQLLLTKDEGEACELAAVLSSLNSERQAIEQKILDEAELMVNELEIDAAWCIVLAKEGWHPGVIGIVASRLAERHHRPTILLAIEGNEARGSGRSIPGYNLIAGLTEQADLLLTYGGHPAAAGLSLAAQTIPALQQALNDHVRCNLPDAGLQPVVHLDAELDPSEITLDLVRSLEKLGPYGAGHPEPIFCSCRWRMADARPIGKDGQHVKLNLQGGGLAWEVLAWRRGQELTELRHTEWLDVAYSPQSNVWNGHERLVLHLRNWRPPQATTTIPVYDGRFLPDKEAYLQTLLAERKSVLAIFWPALSINKWPLLRQFDKQGNLQRQQGPIYLHLVDDELQEARADVLVAATDLIWLDVPRGLPGLEQIAKDFKADLYQQRIHLLYNVNDVDFTCRLMQQNGPSRTAIAIVYRFLKRGGRQQLYAWTELHGLLQKAGYLGTPDQTKLHLQVLQELALIECVFAGEGITINLLAEPATKHELTNSATFSRALEELAAFTEALTWLRGPDAGGVIARSLKNLLDTF